MKNFYPKLLYVRIKVWHALDDYRRERAKANGYTVYYNIVQYTTLPFVAPFKTRSLIFFSILLFLRVYIYKLGQHFFYYQRDTDKICRFKILARFFEKDVL